MDPTIGLEPDQGLSGGSHDDEEQKEEQRDWDAENDYREDLKCLYEGEA